MQWKHVEEKKQKSFIELIYYHLTGLVREASSALDGFEVIDCSTGEGEADEAPWLRVAYTFPEQEILSYVTCV